GRAAGNLVGQLGMVPLWTRALGIQSVNSAWPDFPAGVLGAYRVCLRTFLHSHKERDEYSRSIVRIADDLRCHAVSVLREDGFERQVAGRGASLPPVLAARAQAAFRMRRRLGPSLGLRFGGACGKLSDGVSDQAECKGPALARLLFVLAVAKQIKGDVEAFANLRRILLVVIAARSEERRVGKEWRTQ